MQSLIWTTRSTSYTFQILCSAILIIGTTETLERGYDWFTVFQMIQNNVHDFIY